MEQCRIDKYLWCARVFKTGSQSTEACKKGLIRVNAQLVKPSRIVNLNDTIVVDMKIFVKTLKVTGLPEKRVSAKLVPEFMEDLTPQEEYNKPKIIREVNYEYRERGSGRPTKKQRRSIDSLKKNKLWED